MLSLNRKIYIIIILSALLLLANFNLSHAYTGIMSRENVECRARGGMIREIKGGLVTVKCIQPRVDIFLKNTSGKEKVIKLKCLNISPSFFGANVTENEIAKSGINYVLFKLILSPGRTRKIVIAPLKGKLKKFTFAVLGDSRYRSHIHRKILKKIAVSNALFAINLGDMVNHGTEREYRSLLREISDFPLPYYIVPGNHDTHARNGFRRFRTYISPVDYSFDVGDFHFIMLNTSSGRINNDQFQWLEKEIKGHRNSFVFHHVPPFSPHPRKKRHVLSSPEDSRRFMKMLEKYRVKAMFAGHIHAFLREKRNGVDYIIAGCAGVYPVVPPEEGGYPHYLLVDMDGDKYRVRVFRIDK